MAKRISCFVVASGFCFALAAIPGCNAALGIEEASLRADGTGGGNTSTGGVIRYAGSDSCKADNGACSVCIATACRASGGESLCLGNHDCRGAMDLYAQCLGKGCVEGDCLEQLLADPKLGCFSNCAADCQKKPIYSACQLYCGCLAANCSSTDFGPSAKYADQAACLADCATLPPELITCRRTHCEIAGLVPSEPQHCDHAVGNGFCVASTALPVRDESPTGCQKSLNSFACLADSECCSDHCDSRHSCAAPQ
jgi:hypothetical protein